MKDNMSCSKCGSPVPNNAKYCNDCGALIENLGRSDNIQLPDVELNTKVCPVSNREIKTIEGMESYLEEMVKYANISVEAALNAQLQVLRYVQSPKLYDSSFDLLFANVKKALKYAESPQMCDKIREKTSVMINNYVFFMKAKLQYEIEVNRKEQEGLMADATSMLVKSCVDIVALAAESSGNISTDIVILKVANNFLASSQSGDNFFKRVVRWWHKEKRTQEKTDEFYETLGSLVKKLYKHRKVIGQSDLIAGLIGNYAKELTDFDTGNRVGILNHILTENNESSLRDVQRLFISILFGSAGIWFFVWLFKKISSGFSWVWSKVSGDEYVSSSSQWSVDFWKWIGIIFLLALFIRFVRWLFVKIKFSSELRQAEQEWSEVYQSYLGIVKDFEED